MNVGPATRTSGSMLEASYINGDDHTSVPPETAENHFKATYGATPKSFSRPTRMPNVPTPSVPFVKEAITADKVQQVIQKCKATSTPSPVDQMSYRVFKKCPSLLSALYCAFSMPAGLPHLYRHSGRWGCSASLARRLPRLTPVCPATSGPFP